MMAPIQVMEHEIQLLMALVQVIEFEAQPLVVKA